MNCGSRWLGEHMYERTSKETQLDTIWYEMDMLEFSYREFTNKTPQPEPAE